uniref:Uncharacterized protein n=1 Tax=Trichobilharzia regenti TaxID=157069 RepID=A0AA85J000_TRIRE|nr:unnamed protein product [Trichobilharzia regenti]
MSRSDSCPIHHFPFRLPFEQQPGVQCSSMFSSLVCVSYLISIFCHVFAEQQVLCWVVSIVFIVNSFWPAMLSSLWGDREGIC